MSSFDHDEKSHASKPEVKPTDRDDFAEKSEDPENFQLSDFTDPDAVIASICLSEPCEVITGTEPQNVWVSHGENRVRSMLHPTKRRQLETPCKIPDGPEIGILSTLRLTNSSKIEWYT